MKIKNYLPQVDLPTSTGQTNVSPERMAQGAEAIGGVGQALHYATQELGNFVEKKRELDESLQAANLYNEFKKQVHKKRLELEASPNEMTHVENMTSTIGKLRGETLGRATSRNVQVALDKAMGQVTTEEINGARDFAFKYDLSKKEATVNQLLYDWADEAGKIADPNKQKQLQNMGESLIDSVTGSLFYPDKAAEVKRKFNQQIATARQNFLYGTAELKILVEPNRANAILQEPEYVAGLPPDKRAALLRLGVTESDRLDKKTDEQTKAFSEEMYADLQQRLRAGEDVTPLIYEYGPAGKRMLTKEHFDGLLNHQDAKLKTGEDSDPATLLDVQIRSNTAVPQISEKEVISLMRDGKLSGKHGEQALDQLRTTNKSLRDESKEKLNQTYSDAEKHINRGLGVSGMILQLQEKIDPTQQGLIARAQAELWNRSQGRGGKEDPMAVAQEILPHYQKALHGENLLSIKTNEKIIDIEKYPTKDSMENDFKKGVLSKTDYYRKLKAFKEIQDKQLLNEELETQQKGSMGRK